jgi:hypothetical protein
MRWSLPLLCVLGAAGVWGWAIFAPKEAKLDPLPARFVGTFRLFGYDPPPGREAENPLPMGSAHIFTFRADGTYLLSVLVSGDYEILREEGIVTAGADGVVTMSRISKNRREDRAPPQPFRAEWGKDEIGPFLALRHAEAGYTFRIRPQGAE